MFDVGLLSPVRCEARIVDVVSDDSWLQSMIEVEIALATAQAAQGMIPASVPSAISRAGSTGAVLAASVALHARAAANPVVWFVRELTDAVRRIDPDAADFVHRGSTSQDIFDSAMMLVTTRAVECIRDSLDDVAASLARLATAHADTPAVARTLGMQAVPTTFGARAGVWLTGVMDAIGQLDVLLNEGLPVQLGGAAGTLAGYRQTASSSNTTKRDTAVGKWRELTRAVANELGLATPAIPWHTTRTPVVRVGAALAVTSGALGKIAIDIINGSRTEIGEVAEPAAPGRGASSAMPQKRNPAMSALIHAAAIQVPNLSATLFHCMLAEDERPAGAWHAEWEPLRQALLLVGGAAETAAELCAGLTIDADRLRSNLNLTDGAVVSERLSVVLADKLGKQLAKDVLTASIQEASQTNVPLWQVLGADDRVAAHIDVEATRELLDPENYLGYAPELARAAVDHYKQRRRCR